MKSHLFQTSDVATPRLILLFAGWGMDHRPFRDIAVPGYDICVAWDYRSLETPFKEILNRYEEIAVVAWSFGVPATAKFISDNPHLPITAKIAINGTQHPVDDTYGIPESIFQGTLDSLNEKNLGKFYLRMAGSSDRFKAFAANIPDRDIEELKAELVAVKTAETPVIIWDKAIIANTDRIIPSDNQVNAWGKEALEIMQYDGAHLPDFNTMLPRLLTDKTLVQKRFHRATKTYDTNAIIQKHIAERLIDLWQPEQKSHLDILEIGCGTGYSTRLIYKKSHFGSLRLWDLTLSDEFVKEFTGDNTELSVCDAEIAIRNIPDASLDAVISASTVQWFNSLPTFLSQLARVLRPGGKAIISTFGPETMREINTALGKKSTYPDTYTLRGMIPNTLNIEHLTEEILTLTFASSIEALRHVSLTGVNALGSPVSPSATRALINSYPLQPSSEALLTYQPIYMILTKKNTHL